MKLRIWSIPIALAALAAAAFGAAVLAENIDPLGNNSQFAWSENAGWLNAEPANCADCGVQVTETGLTGFMWGENVGWINLSCKNNNTCAGPAGNWGVTNNGSGTLSGYGWAENAGWISFSCQNNPASCAGTGNYGVSISGSTGVFSGQAWGENIGWISFSNSTPVAYQVQTSDDDADNVFAGSDNCPNWPNTSQALPPFWTVPAGDSDCDGFTDARETYLTTESAQQCAATSAIGDENAFPDRWPLDFNDNQFLNTIDVGNWVGKLGLDNTETAAGWTPRLDLSQSTNGLINTVDVGFYVGKLGRSCSLSGT